MAVATTALAVGLAAKGIDAIAKGIANRRARKRSQEAAAALDQNISDAFADKSLGLTAAQMNELNLQNQMAGISAFKTQRENLKRQKAAGTISTADYNQQIAGLNKAVQDSTAAGRKDVQTLAGDLRTQRQQGLAAAAEGQYGRDLQDIQMQLGATKELSAGLSDAASFGAKGALTQALGQQKFDRQKELLEMRQKGVSGAGVGVGSTKAKELFEQPDKPK